MSRSTAPGRIGLPSMFHRRGWVRCLAALLRSLLTPTAYGCPIDSNLNENNFAGDGIYFGLQQLLAEGSTLEVRIDAVPCTFMQDPLGPSILDHGHMIPRFGIVTTDH